MTLGIMLLNMFKLRRLFTKRLGKVPVQVPHPLVQGRVARANVADVALEVLHVDRVEADNRRVEADVGFGDVGG